MAPTDPDLEKHLLLLLNQISTKIAQDASLLEFFFNGGPEEAGASGRFAVFSLQIPYLYHEGDVGQLARDAILLVLSVSQSVEPVGHFIGEHSSFCAVLASGLSGCFSQLPRHLCHVLQAAEDWHYVTMGDVETVSSLNSFYGALVFCNAVVQHLILVEVGHPFVQEQLMEFIYHGFLESVVAPALCEKELGLDEVISGTAYLDLCLRTVTEGPLRRVFLRLLLEYRYEDQPLLSLLVHRIATSSRLSVVTLHLFRTLLELRCEDVAVELYLQYLLPATHVRPSQAARLPRTDFFPTAASRLLRLLPELPSPRPGQPYSPASSDAEGESNMARDRYLEYLAAAREEVSSCQAACSQSWLLPYDGREPDPQLFRDDVTSVPSSPDGTFSRSGSIRRARPNSYFVRRHTSVMTSVSAGPPLSASDLAVLGPEEIEDALDDESVVSGGPSSSAFSTPRIRDQRAGPGGPDFFKLTFEDDDLGSTPPRTPQDSLGEESEVTSAGPGGPMAFVLRGWAEVQDAETFGDILNRVRTTPDAASASLEDNIAYLDKISERLERRQSKISAAESVNGPTEPPVVPSLELATPVNGDLDQHPLKDRDSGMGDSAPVDEDTSAASPLRSSEALGRPVFHKGRYSSPTLGPFLTAVFEKLESFTENSLYINLQLTGVLAKLASYPQPLLSSLLLNSSLVLQPSVPSLLSQLEGIKTSLETTAHSVPAFSALTGRARRSLDAKSRRARAATIPSRSAAASHQPHLLDPERPRSASEQQAPVSPRLERKPRSATGPPARPRLSHARLGHPEEGGLEGLRTRQAVYAAVVFEDFVLELAAIAQEHAILASPEPPISS